MLVALLLAVPALLERMLLRQPGPGLLSILNIVLSFVFDAFIVVVIFRRVFTDDQPNSETVFGALCHLSVSRVCLCQHLRNGGFHSAKSVLSESSEQLPRYPHRFDFIYYSFATMTSLGAVGIIPVSIPARSLSVIESILGVLYLAVLIARLMDAYRHPSVSGHS